jgi:hypothetical protein
VRTSGGVSRHDKLLKSPVADEVIDRRSGQEAFAQRIVAGFSVTAAYASAYGRAHDVTSRVNGRRLLTNANIRARISQIESDAALSSLPTIRRVLEEAGSNTMDRIRNGSIREACKAVDCFADTVLKLSKSFSQ